MIKSVSLLTRKSGLSHEEFVKHWLKVHAPLAHAVPGLRRYVQSHIVGERTRPDIPATDVEVDGVAETWYDDLAAMERGQCLSRRQGAACRRRPLHPPRKELHHRGEGDHSEPTVISSPPRKRGSRGSAAGDCRPGFPLFAGMTNW